MMIIIGRYNKHRSLHCTHTATLESLQGSTECCFYETTTRAHIGESLVRRNNRLFSSVDTQDVEETMDQKLLNGQDDSSKVEAPLSSPPQVAESHKPQCAEVCRGCCNWRCGGRFVGAWLFCVLCAIITVLFASGNKYVAWLLAAGVPFIAFSVYASEIFGGTSVDKGLTFLVIVLHTIVIIILSFSRSFT